MPNFLNNKGRGLTGVIPEENLRSSVPEGRREIRCSVEVGLRPRVAGRPHDRRGIRPKNKEYQR